MRTKKIVNNALFNASNYTLIIGKLCFKNIKHAQALITKYVKNANLLLIIKY